MNHSASELVIDAALIRKYVRLSIGAVERAHGIDFGSYFATELQALGKLEQDKLVKVSRESIAVTSQGRLLVRIVCMAFDRHLREGRQQASYSKVL